MNLTTAVMTFLIFNPLLAAPQWTVTTENAQDNKSVNIYLNIEVVLFNESMEYEPVNYEASGCKTDWDLEKNVKQTFLRYVGKPMKDQQNNCTLLLEGKTMRGSQSRSFSSLETVNDINAMNGVDDSQFVIVKAKFQHTQKNLELTLWTVEKEAIDTLSGMNCASLSIQTDSQIYPFRMLI